MKFDHIDMEYVVKDDYRRYGGLYGHRSRVVLSTTKLLDLYVTMEVQRDDDGGFRSEVAWYPYAGSGKSSLIAQTMAGASSTDLATITRDKWGL